VHRYEEILAWLGRSYLFEGIDAAELGALAALATTRTLGRDECLFRTGDPANELYVVGAGEIVDRFLDVDGREVVHFVHGPGMTLGEPGYFSVERNRVLDAIAVRPGTVVVRLDRRVLTPFIDAHDVVKDRALEALASNTRWLGALVVALATRPLADRLVIRLLELVDSAADAPGEPASTPPISQSMLAAMIGVSRENVNRALAALALDGVVRQEDGRYVLIDETRLRREMGQTMPIVSPRDRRSGP
jgi:CRP-like cAMP-binding protein